MNKLDFCQIELQFRLSTRPNNIRELDPETPKEREVRLNRAIRPNGVKIIEPTEKCYLLDLLRDLEVRGYELTNAFSQERIDDNVLGGTRKQYYMVRYVFNKHDPNKAVNIRDEVYCAVAKNDLYQICDSAMYQVVAFSNPFFNKGKEVSGQRILNINLRARQPLYLPNGQPIKVWKKDDEGRPIDKVCLRPEYKLCVLGNTIKPIKA